MWALGFVLVVVGMLFYAYPIIQKRYFSDSSPESQGGAIRENNVSEEDEGLVSSEEKETVDGTDEIQPSESSDNGVSENPEDIGSVNIDTNERDGSADVFANITNYHCSSGCEAFANNFQYLEYCQQVCGISEIKDVSESDCKKKDGLPADYCYKDLAINKLDASFCNKIDDGNIFTTCKTRILQEVIEK